MSFTRFDREQEVSLLSGGLAVLMVGIGARQAASPTARAQAGLGAAARDDGLFAPADGAFNAAAAHAALRWTGAGPRRPES